ncbi:MAG: hypothetical protein KDC67_14640, partial [Ignavibacteriae bacterium]|nr:hypothetical protein [Ignavibacteriota bacterium]
DSLTLVKHLCFVFCEKFYTTYKQFDAETYPSANEYLTKMFSTCRKILLADIKFFRTLERMLIVEISKKIDFQDLQNADDTFWIDTYTQYLDDAIRLYSDVRKNEKLEYNNI